jgi:hypothetical protein
MKLLICSILLLTHAAISLAAQPALQDGDLIFQTSLSAQSLAVQRATRSRYSHMGIILMRNGKPHVFEAIATVRYTPVEQWIARGQGRHYVVKRLKNASTALTSAVVNKILTDARRFEGRPYDLTFEWSDDRIYCSELVWKLYDNTLHLHIGELQKIKEFNLDDPIVRSKLKERYGTHIPQDEPAISPDAMFKSSLLTTVIEK